MAERRPTLTVALVAPPPGHDADPLVLVGNGRMAVLRMAARAWEATYPGSLGIVEVFEASDARAALAGRVLVRDVADPPSEDDPPQRLVDHELVPLPDLPPISPESDPFYQLLCEFMASSAPYAKVQQKTARAGRVRKYSLQKRLQRVAREEGLPIRAVTRDKDIYLARTDWKASVANGKEES